MRDEIDWAEVGAGGRFEQIVSVLLSTLHPDSQRIDGAGGDGGRDHQFATPERLDYWQSKYFLRRLNEAGGRKAQIISSLVTAAQAQPDSWTLVTPMVHSPEELTWFNGLKQDYPFPLTWRGGDWLNARLADYPGIVRHFMGANDEYVALIRELKEERAAEINGLPAAVERIRELANRIDAANPFYRVDFSVEGGQITNKFLVPKYVGAENDSPIEVRFILVVNPGEEDLLKSFRDALHWGEELDLPATNVRDVVIDAPHGLGASLEAAQLRISSAREDIDLRLRLVVRSPAGRQLAALPARLVSRAFGKRGITLHGRDLTGIVNARVRLDDVLRKVELNLTYNQPHDIFPGALLPVVRFMQHATAPNTMSFGVGDAPSSAPVALPQRDLEPQTYAAFVEGLGRVQDAAGEAFPVPSQWTRKDELEVRRAVRLLSGERVQLATGIVHFVQDSPDLIEAAGDAIISLALDRQEPYTFDVCGHEINLGPCTLYIQQCRPSLDPLPGQPDTDFRIAVKPEPGFGIEVALGSLTHDPGQLAAPPA